MSKRGGMWNYGRRPAGMDLARAFARRPFTLRTPDDDLEFPLAEVTDRPEVYRRRSFRDRVVPILARLPKRFFETVTVDRGVYLVASPFPPGVWDEYPPPEVILPEAHLSRAACMSDFVRPEPPEGDRPSCWLVRLGRSAMERYSADAFTGVVVHELCHVYLEHDGNMYELDDSTWQQWEDDAVALACDMGFRTETEALLREIHEMFGDDVGTGTLPTHAR